MDRIERIEPRPTWIAPIERERPERGARERREERAREERERRAREERARPTGPAPERRADEADDEPRAGGHIDVRA
ncbi:MAG TPA: hypothetical protein VK756_06285 [Solirubrobacteraceae bacterium]|jgi:hypothetical protein|nr:hypothetical protein [Solirubrobacteraceae bacterium]